MNPERPRSTGTSLVSNKTLRAGLLVRVSTEEQAKEGYSIGAQRKALAAYAESQGWDIAAWYVDEGFSGKDLNRPGMQRLMADVARGALDVVAVWKLDRLSRKQKHILHLLEDVLEPHGVGFRSITQPFDTTTAFGRATIQMLGTFAELERATILERMKFGRQGAVESGKPIGRPNYGYRVAGKNRREIVESEAIVVRRIYQMYLDGLGVDSIIRRLNGEGVPSPRAGQTFSGRTVGQAWNRRTVNIILTTPAYVGRIPYLGRGYDGQAPGIIDQETWDTVQRLRRERGPKYRSHGNTYLLTGIARCQACGGALRGHANTRGTRYYECCNRYPLDDRPRCPAPSWRQDRVNAQVIVLLKEFCGDPAKIEAGLRQQAVDVPDIGNLDSLSAELEQVNKEIRRLVTLARMSDAVEELASDLSSLRSRKSWLTSEMERNGKPRPKVADEVQRILVEVKNATGTYEAATPARRKGIIASLWRAAYVNQDGHIVRVEWQEGARVS